MSKILTILLLFVCFLLNGQNRRSSLRNGIVAMYRFERTTGSVIEEKQDFDGTNNGAARGVTGKVGNAFDFEESESDYVTMGDVMDFDSDEPFTIMAWVTRETIVDFQGIVSKMESSGNFRGYLFSIRSNGTGLNPNRLNATIRNENIVTERLITYGETQITDANFHHVVMTYDGSSTEAGIDFYLDGNAETETYQGDEMTGTIVSSAPFNIGARNNNSFFHDGKIDEVKIYNRVTSDLEVAQDYNSGNGLLFVQENFKKDKNYEKLINYVISRQYFGWITGAN